MIRSFIWTKFVKFLFFFISSLFRFLLLLFLQIVGRPLPSTGKQILLVINSTTVIFRFLILRIYLHFNEGKRKEKNREFKKDTSNHRHIFFLLTQFQSKQNSITASLLTHSSSTWLIKKKTKNTQKHSRRWKD